MEAACYESSSFTTLTYDDDHLPLLVDDGGSCVSTLVPDDLRLLLKRYRKRGAVRFFAAGEYGDRTQRAHWHVVFFGWNPFDCEEVLRECWTKGFIKVDEITHSRANYIAHYCVKKWNKQSEYLGGRHPEFSRMSLRPGIGKPFVPRLAEAMRKRGTAQWMAEQGDVPALCRIGGKQYPLDHYIRNALRRELDIPERSSERIVQAPNPLYSAEELEGARATHEKMLAESRSPRRGAAF